MKLAIVGATGLVGSEIIKVIEERNFPFSDLILVASDKSFGKEIIVNKTKYFVKTVEDLLKEKPAMALFAAGSEISKVWAPKLAEIGCKVVDNSSHFRMSPNHKLIIPEINGSKIDNKDSIIANPNCSTIQLLMAIAPLHKAFNIKRVVVSTYQSVTGTGKNAVDQLNNEENNIAGEMAYPHPIYRNALPHIDSFLENGYTKEEMKIINETHKILDDSIEVTATAVRIPIEGGHCESVNICFSEPYILDDVYKILKTTTGVIVLDDVEKNTYPMPIDSKGKDEVFVGRIRIDFSQPNTLNMWIVSDNLRKGAATNAVQIAESLVEKNFV